MTAPDDGGPASRTGRALAVLPLLMVPQAVLYGPSLFGDKVLLPLDILREPGFFLPLDRDEMVTQPVDEVLSDLVLEIEIYRRYAVDAVRAGRLPLWTPLIYAGTPFLANPCASVFYPLRVVDYLFPGPRAIAWTQLFKSVVGGVGAYLFVRLVLGVAFWPAALGAGLWPLCGFLVLWTGFQITHVGAQLPWILLATDGVVRRPWSWWPLGLALATAVSLVSGHAAVAAHLLLVSAIYGTFRICQLRRRPAAAALLGGWMLGVLLSGPQTLPAIEYLRESWRIQQRQAGMVETAPVGVAALPAVAMPYWYGSSQRHAVDLLGGNRLEGPPAAYAGLLALLVLAPVGFAHARLRRFQVFWLGLWVFGLSQVLGLPLVSRVFELPVLNTLRNNRLTVVSAWAAVAMATTGLDALWRREVRWTAWCWAAVALLAGLAVWCVVQSSTLPRALADVLDGLRQGTARTAPPIDSVEAVEAVGRWFAGVGRAYAALVVGALLAWLAIRLVPARRAALVGVLGVAALAEVVAQSYGVSPQFDRAWYFPRVELYERLRALGPGRIAGGPGTLPANLPMAQGFPDVRGYDAADPARMVEFLQLFPNRVSPAPFEYAAVQYWVPRVGSPLPNLAGIAWLVTVGAEPPRAVDGDRGLWVQEGSGVLPRAFMPRGARVVNDKAERLRLLGAPDFDPRAVVLLESSDPLPDLGGDGDAKIVVDEPEHVAIDLDVRAAGFVVLADRWAPGWEATVDGVAHRVLIADHAFRAVQVDAGARRLDLRYRPASFRMGLWAAAAALIAMAGWAGVMRRQPARG